MLSEAQKADIRQHYKLLCENKSLTSRPGQRLMIAEVAKTLGNIRYDDDSERNSEGHICVVEAGTGTGKTLAYALTCIYMAQSLKKKLVISTATVALQEQIVMKDLPDLLRHSDMTFQFALAKGRGRYLCLSKLESHLEGDGQQQATLYPDEVIASSAPEQGTLYNEMINKLAANQWDGDRDSWPESLEAELWTPLTSDHHQCTGRKCPHIKNCFYFKARENLENVDCVVTNHDLVLADLALGGGAILPAPADTIYVFDEGHHLPDKALQHFAHHSRLVSTRKWLDQADKAMSSLIKTAGLQSEIGRIVQGMAQAYPALRDQMAMSRAIVEPLFGDVAAAEQGRSIHHRFEGGVVPASLRNLAAELKAGYTRLAEGFERILKELDEAMEDSDGEFPKQEAERWYPAVGMLRNRADANAALWQQYEFEDAADKPPMGRWVSFVDNAGGGDFEVCASPIMASHTLYSHLWSRCFGAVVTSATLAALGSFERFIRRSGVPRDSNFTQVGSPFNYPQAAQLIVPTFVDPSNALAHTEAIIDDLPQRISQQDAALVLFSSRKQMRGVYFELPSSFREKVLLQDDYSKHALLSKHREAVDEGKGSVIFGLASMAEGVDLPGQYCTHVIIAKIPFAVPDDPVEAALSEWVQAAGGNPFMEITVPDAAIKLVQASGRLLRTETDTGKVAILDSRLLTRRYGRAIIDSLPPFAQQLG
ncbi:ATP-dependent DNA helicase DinG [Sinobacterium caligoides]|uniref:ATP-dependent DNA helicase DinG n=1 Tax=Sinobacterium caligoides TaxID=933926 RepID=A0A3N2D4Y2_9GAMM|nr:ATP-dependent DNA helicase DinG [Sinobacterium caligoides]ROR94866.1 ATP-dependent DNA helicase DinG [Sinobacterium caligoides]